MGGWEWWRNDGAYNVTLLCVDKTNFGWIWGAPKREMRYILHFKLSKSNISHVKFEKCFGVTSKVKGDQWASNYRWFSFCLLPDLCSLFIRIHQIIQVIQNMRIHISLTNSSSHIKPVQRFQTQHVLISTNPSRADRECTSTSICIDERPTSQNDRSRIVCRSVCVPFRCVNFLVRHNTRTHKQHCEKYAHVLLRFGLAHNRHTH